MLVGGVVVYKVMKKVGKLSEARMVLPPEPKLYPMVSDKLFENKVKGYAGIKGGTAAASKEAARRKKLKEDEVPDPRDLAMNRAPQASLSTTNSPKRATKASVQVGGPYDLTAEATDDWIQDAEDDIEKRGTKGKCTPITKKGCTGKAKSLAKTFKKMAKGKKNESNVGPQSQKLADKTMSSDDQKALADKRAEWRSKLRPTGDDGKTESSTPKPVRQARARAEAGKPIKRGTASTVANDSGSEMSQRMKAAEKL